MAVLSTYCYVQDIYLSPGLFLGIDVSLIDHNTYHLIIPATIPESLTRAPNKMKANTGLSASRWAAVEVVTPPAEKSVPDTQSEVSSAGAPEKSKLDASSTGSKWSDDVTPAEMEKATSGNQPQEPSALAQEKENPKAGLKASRWSEVATQPTEEIAPKARSGVPTKSRSKVNNHRSENVSIPGVKVSNPKQKASNPHQKASNPQQKASNPHQKANNPHQKASNPKASNSKASNFKTSNFKSSNSRASNFKGSNPKQKAWVQGGQKPNGRSTGSQQAPPKRSLPPQVKKSIPNDRSEVSTDAYIPDQADDEEL